MSQLDKLLEKARTNPHNLRLQEAVRLAEHLGFVHRSGGKHPHVLKRPGLLTTLNFQELGGFVKPYQVKQMLSAIDRLISERE